ncbi:MULTISPECIES: MNIO family bufferin maturase [Pseudoalteromonas]|uniref:DUF692 domain-containing protein n=1 Tax=Pseudoalteromonas haloplanktis TaxID=228 RepID=A0ABU1BAW3_PSEHA|nr:MULTISPECIES: DUF692 domain-containing protein [Pseudoalteromonas]MCF6142700.1 hypothetical protein [Pseudoalteromonas mariniglutinosa NCIMB 1770]MDQ9090916.1 DUF692 domain-containing protein [Pseudoalteromonas haloplanktis]
MQTQFLGFGLGLRASHFEQIITDKPAVDWFEIISENYFVAGGKPWYYLNKIRADYPVVMHGVSMSIGSTGALNFDYLQALKSTIARVEPQWVSDHLCFSQVGDFNSHDLLPMPYTNEALEHLASRIHHVQEFLGREMIFENVSSYLTYKDSQMSEWDFLAALHNKTGCRFLMDVNNVYVSARNHQFDAMTFLNAIPTEAIAQIHLAGHQDFGSHIIDTHDEDVSSAVWDLFENYAKQLDPVSTMIERDDNLGSLQDLMAELEHARQLVAPIWQLGVNSE